MNKRSKRSVQHSQLQLQLTKQLESLILNNYRLRAERIHLERNHEILIREVEVGKVTWYQLLTWLDRKQKETAKQRSSWKRSHTKVGWDSIGEKNELVAIKAARTWKWRTEATIRSCELCEKVKRKFREKSRRDDLKGAVKWRHS